MRSFRWTRYTARGSIPVIAGILDVSESLLNPQLATEKASPIRRETWVYKRAGHRESENKKPARGGLLYGVKSFCLPNLRFIV